MRQGQTISERASAALAYIPRDRNNPIWTLGSFFPSVEGRIGDGKFEPLPGTAQTCLALRNGVERLPYGLISRRPRALAELAWILSCARSRYTTRRKSACG